MAMTFASTPLLPTTQLGRRFCAGGGAASSQRATHGAAAVQKCGTVASEFYSVRGSDEGRLDFALKGLKSSGSRSSSSSSSWGHSRQQYGGEWKLGVEAKGDVYEELSKTALRPFSTEWFKDAYHQYKAWPEVHRILSGRDVKSVSRQEANEMVQSGAATLIDVREAQNFEQVHAHGSFSAPLFRLIEGNDFKANLRRFGYALLTDFAGTERNPNFINQALQAVDGDHEKLVIVLCDIGGTLSTFVEKKGPKPKKFADPERRFGRASRSLKALFELQEAGFKKVMYLEGGLNSWIHERMPLVGSR